MTLNQFRCDGWMDKKYGEKIKSWQRIGKGIPAGGVSLAVSLARDSIVCSSLVIAETLHLNQHRIQRLVRWRELVLE